MGGGGGGILHKQETHTTQNYSQLWVLTVDEAVLTKEILT